MLTYRAFFDWLYLIKHDHWLWCENSDSAAAVAEFDLTIIPYFLIGNEPIKWR